MKDLRVWGKGKDPENLLILVNYVSYVDVITLENKNPFIYLFIYKNHLNKSKPDVIVDLLGGGVLCIHPIKGEALGRVIG